MNEANALQIIKNLAEGVDPFTGEIFPDDSPYQKAYVVRALQKAIEALSKEVKHENKKNRIPPARAGKPWDETESETLVREFDKGTNIGELAKQHQRTRGAIESQLVKLGKIPRPIIKKILR